MLRKSIATALLLAMMAWAEMALAPMLAMHTGHVHAASEMAGHMAAHRHAMPAAHPCCPELRKTGNPLPVEFAATTLPCQDEHRCCFQQGPQSIPAPVSAGRRISPDIASAEIAEAGLARDAESQVPLTTAVVPGSPPDLLGMILRI